MNKILSQAIRKAVSDYKPAEKINNNDKRPDLGCFYYSKDQIPRYSNEDDEDLWNTTIAMRLKNIG